MQLCCSCEYHFYRVHAISLQQFHKCKTKIRHAILLTGKVLRIYTSSLYLFCENTNPPGQSKRDDFWLDTKIIDQQAMYKRKLTAFANVAPGYSLV